MTCYDLIKNPYRIKVESEPSGIECYWLDFKLDDKLHLLIYFSIIHRDDFDILIDFESTIKDYYTSELWFLNRSEYWNSRIPERFKEIQKHFSKYDTPAMVYTIHEYAGIDKFYTIAYPIRHKFND